MIFLDTNVISETFRQKPSEAVLSWIARFESELAVSTVVVGEILHGIRRMEPDIRAARWEANLKLWLGRLADSIYSYDHDGADAYGNLMAKASIAGKPISAPDGMIAAIAKANRGKLATRNTRHFEHAGLELINPWDQ